ncbi:MAG: hypothetical protein II305_05380 [Clostridia bacterium]|nr:hypothetical protein [Clostridia bacterium]
MDKETLSNYGWIIVCVIIVAIMITLASPFGTYIKDAFVSLINGFGAKVATGTDNAVSVETFSVAAGE